MAFGSVLAPAFARRVARATRHRLPSTSTVRTITTTPTLFAKPQRQVATPPSSIPTPTALSALLSRLSLPPNTTLHPVLVACLTHPSFTSQPSILDFPSETPQETETDGDLTNLSEQITETNEILSSLGNSLLGLFASEHLSTQFPHLPSTALKAAVTAYVGPKACMSVARSLGLGTQNKVDDNFNGIGVRWRRIEAEQGDVENTPVAKRFQKYAGGEKGHRRHERKDNFEDVVAGVVKAFVGLIYRERVSWRERQRTMRSDVLLEFVLTSTGYPRRT
jgi:large subunit ribosomal protein L44